MAGKNRLAKLLKGEMPRWEVESEGDAVARAHSPHDKRRPESEDGVVSVEVRRRDGVYNVSSYLYNERRGMGDLYENEQARTPQEAAETAKRLARSGAKQNIDRGLGNEGEFGLPDFGL